MQAVALGAVERHRRGWRNGAERRGVGAREPINVVWFLVAAVATYAVAFRFYSKFLAARVLMLDDRRATPAQRMNDGRDFVPTNRWVVFGHHLRPSPARATHRPNLVCAVRLRARTLWIIVGVVLGGAVQDFLILAGSVRRDGKSLGKWRARKSACSVASRR